MRDPCDRCGNKDNLRIIHDELTNLTIAACKKCARKLLDLKGFKEVPRSS